MLKRNPVIAIIRCHEPVDLVGVCRALFDGGLEAVEITAPTPGALKAVTQLRQQIGDGQLIGNGTVTSADDARRCIDAGAQFLVSPIVDVPTIDAAKQAGVPIFPGALTPTEIVAADRAGATMIKVFPAEQLGPSYVKAVLAPLPHLKLVPTGGVRLHNIDEWLDAGVAAVGVGGTLVDPQRVKAGDFTALRAEAQKWTDATAGWSSR